MYRHHLGVGNLAPSVFFRYGKGTGSSFVSKDIAGFTGLEVSKFDSTESEIIVVSWIVIVAWPRVVVTGRVIDEDRWLR